MQFVVYGVPQTFMPLSVFRERHGLPESFGVAAFLPKDPTGLARIDSVGETLRQVRAAVLDAVPSMPPPQGWMGFNLRLQLIFQRALRAVNGDVGLKPSELQYAVAGFGDVCQMYLHLALRRRLQGQPPPAFAPIYADWFNRSIEVTRLEYPYSHRGENWSLRVIRSAYGRMGLFVQMQDVNQYVYDAADACPAAGFMASLLDAVTGRLAAALQSETKQERK